ncbi:MAG: hypothetical protein WCH34_09835, partial [Bacteroidota bacterium]
LLVINIVVNNPLSRTQVMKEKRKIETPYEKELKKAQWRELMNAQIKDEMKNNPKVLKFYDKYESSSVDSFIEDYANKKVRIIEWGPKYIEWEEKEQLQWLEQAFEGIKEIQQKKLFDIQCLWRANKIQLKDILILWDFKDWERDILNCPFIPAVTQDEVDLYIQYLQSFNYERNAYWRWEQWQDYDEIKEAYHTDNANRNFPEWYDFYNSRKGTGVYLTFPDLKGDKEKHYYEILRKDYSENHPEEIKKQKELEKQIDRRPFLNYQYGDEIQWFVDTFEDEKTQEYSELGRGIRSLDDYDFEWADEKALLEDILEPLPVEAWHDWKEALHRTADNYRRAKIAEAMPLAFDKYNMYINSGIPFESDNHRSDEFNKTIREKMIDNIIRARVLNGEPPDLNY